MPISGLFEVGARILRRHARTLLSVAILIQLPGAILDAAAQQRLADAVSPLLAGLDTDTPTILAPTASQTDSILNALLQVGAAMLVSMVLGAIAAVAYSTVVSRDYHGQRSTLGEVIALALRRAFAAVAAAFLASLAVVVVVASTIALAIAPLTLMPGAAGEAGGPGVFLALLVGVSGGLVALTLLVRLCLATIAVAVEGIGPIGGIRRSWHLTGRNTWRTFTVLAILTFIISLLASFLVQLLGVAINGGLGGRLGMATTIDAFIAAGVSVVFAPVAVVIQATLYFDLRVRRDAWDLPATSDDATRTPDDDPLTATG